MDSHYLIHLKRVHSVSHSGDESTNSVQVLKHFYKPYKEWGDALAQY